MITLNATKRDPSIGHKDGYLSAVVYGPKQESIPIAIDEKDFANTLRKAGESTVIELSGVTSVPLQVLINDVDLDPVKSTPRHADFLAVEKGAKVEVTIPLDFVGVSPAVKVGANIVKVLHEIEIEAEATHLPHNISVDISSLQSIDDQIHVRDLTIPEGVTVLTGADEVVVLAQEVAEEEEATAKDITDIEVEKKGKETESSTEDAKE